MSLPPIQIPLGAMRFNSDMQKLEFFNGMEWLQVDTTEAATIAGRGLMFSGYTAPTSWNTIDYITIQTQGNSIDFGDISHKSHAGVGMGSRTRGIYAGGQTTPPGSSSNIIEYVTIATQGDAVDFGDMISGTTLSVGGVSNTTRGVWGGGNTPTKTDTIEYITIAQKGNGTDFGNLTDSRADGASVCSPTRGVFGGGYDPSQKDVMDYITTSSTGNAVDFGNLTQSSRVSQSACNATRGLFAGGYTPTTYNNIDFINMASLGNAQDFGDLTTTSGIGGSGGSMSDSTRGVFVHVYDPPNGEINTISYITFATKGNSTDFGDRSQSGYQGPGKTSNTHGGVQ